MAARVVSRGGRSGGRTAKRGKRRGRSVIALSLLGFVLVATSVIWRRTFGYTQSRELQQLERRRNDLRAQRAQLEREIRDAASSARLGPVVEQRLRMRVPNDSQVIVLPRQNARSSARDGSK